LYIFAEEEMQQVSVSTMKALVIDQYGPPEDARVSDVPVPKPHEGSLLVRMRAAGVNPFDYKVVTGAVKDWMPVKFPYIPGMDGAGEVAEVGAGVTGWQAGDEVVGMFAHGTFAEYAVIRASEPRLCKKPERLDFVHAAAIPEAGLTANTVVRAAGVRPGQSVLIIGASGGVGLFATQLAKAQGARIVATGKQSDVEYLRQLGADTVIDYTTGDAIDQARQHNHDLFDHVFDFIGSGEALLADAGALRESGTLTSTLGGPDAGAFSKPINVQYIQMAAQPGDLEDLVRRAAEGALRVEVGCKYDLIDAARALADLESTAKHTRGKLVIRVA
jgi:NADPH:quinone reductase